MAIVAVFAAPALNHLTQSGTVNKAAGDVGAMIELSRTYAMANHTFVRIAFGEATSDEDASPVLIVLALYSAGGTESADPSAPTNWPLLNRPLLFRQFVMNDHLNAFRTDTSGDDLPSAASASWSFSRKVGRLGQVSFTSVIEFNPSGEACVASGTPSRFIKIGIDRRPPQDGKNPVILRLSGINGNVAILRKENM